MFPVKAASTGSLSLMNTHITPSFPILFSTEELKRDCNPATKFDAVAVEKNGRMNSTTKAAFKNIKLFQMFFFILFYAGVDVCIISSL